MLRETALPAGAPAGTCTLTWYSPTPPGARPENWTAAGMPPMETSGMRLTAGARPAGQRPGGAAIQGLVDSIAHAAKGIAQGCVEDIRVAGMEHHVAAHRAGKRQRPV